MSGINPENLNYGSQSAPIKLGNGNDPEPLMKGRKFIDLLTGEKIDLDDPGIAIAGQSVRILKAG